MWYFLRVSDKVWLVHNNWRDVKNIERIQLHKVTSEIMKNTILDDLLNLQGHEVLTLGTYMQRFVLEPFQKEMGLWSSDALDASDDML